MEGDLKTKIELRPGKNAKIISNIKRDSTFLMEHGIMDYSLLLGVHYKYKENTTTGTSKADGFQSRYLSSKQYHMGIIDILKQFGVKKTIENFNKRVLLCRGDRISAVRPPRYKMYFDEYMERHIFVTSSSVISRSPKRLGSFRNSTSSFRNSTSSVVMDSKEDDEEEEVEVLAPDDILGLEEKKSEDDDGDRISVVVTPPVSGLVSPPALPPPSRDVSNEDDGGGDGVELMPV